MVLCGRNVLNGDKYGRSSFSAGSIIGHFRPPINDFGIDSGFFTGNLDHVVPRVDTVGGDGSIRPVLLPVIEDKGE